MSTDDLKIVWKLWLSVGLFVLFIVLSLTLDWEGDFTVDISLGVVGLERVFEKGSSTQIVLTILASLALLYPLVCNYEDFFPHHLFITVYFDDNGVNEALKEITPSGLQLVNVNLATDWRERKRDYLQNLGPALQHVGVKDFRISDQTTGTGETTFRVEKRSGAFQSYQITESHGHIDLTNSDETNDSSLRQSQFELRRSSYNTINASPLDIYSPLRWTKIIRPLYGQYVRTGPETREFLGNVTGITKVRFFPMRTISKTVYMVSVETTTDDQDEENANYYFPVAYATYEPD